MSVDLTVAQWRAARQCAKRAWLEQHAPDRAGAPDPEAATGAAIRRAIATLARARFPGGIAVAEHGDDAVSRTRVLLADADVPAIFDAVVVGGGVRMRVDVLARRPDGRFDLYAVQAATGVRPEHVDELALRLHALGAAGVGVATSAVLHVDREQVRGDAPLPITRLLRAVDVADEVRARVPDVVARLQALRDTLARGDVPGVAMSPHCTRPHRCAFWDACAAGAPADPVTLLPRLAANQHAALRGAGIDRIADIPDDWWLTGPQTRARAAHRGGRAVVSPDLASVLARAEPPAAYLDFETISPAVPLFPGTRPYEIVPFQWSLHRVDAQGRVGQAAFLADGPGDPRPAFIARLLGATTGDEPILVYSGYEANVLDGLARAFPAHAADLDALRTRLVDLLEIVLAHVYHPGFAGSFSLKRVAPVLAPEVAWAADGGFRGGREASEAFLVLRDGRLGQADTARLRRDLYDYCATDTQALVALHRALRVLAGLA